MRLIVVGAGPTGSRIANQALSESIVADVPFVVDPDSQRREELARAVGGQALSAIGSLPSAAEPDDVAILCTVSRAMEVDPDIRKLAEAGYNVVTTCEELAYPDSNVQADLNEAALRTERVIAATGANPGFVMDRLVVLAARAWYGVERITVVRRVDTSRRRDSLIAKTGAGLDRSAFEREVEEGRLGHVGLRESAEFIASSLGWDGKASVTTEPHITDDGDVTGIHQLATIESNVGSLKSDLTMAKSIPDRDEVLLEGREDELRVLIPGGYHGDTGTIARVLSVMTAISNLSPGFYSLRDLPVWA